MQQKNDYNKPQAAAEKLLKQAYHARGEERYADAKRDVLEAIDLCQKANARFALAQALKMLGQIERDQQQLDSALSHYAEALQILRELGDADNIAHTVRHVGDIHRSAGRLELAEPCYDEALEIYRSNPQTNPINLANAIRGLALLKSEMNATDEAKQLWEEARALYDAVHVSEGVAECEQRIADLDSLPN